MLLIDDETQSYWDHITGEAVHGPLKGHVLQSWPLCHTTVAAALVEHPGVLVHRVPMTAIGLAMRLAHNRTLNGQGFIPPPFRTTMEAGDPRLHETTNGLGVIVEGRARFYPMNTLVQGIEEDWSGRTMRIGLGELDGAPHATWANDNRRPMQILSRWYGFSYTYPSCELYQPKV